jgi:hypothetical protein
MLTNGIDGGKDRGPEHVGITRRRDVVTPMSPGCSVLLRRSCVRVMPIVGINASTRRRGGCHHIVCLARTMLTNGIGRERPVESTLASRGAATW